MHCVSADENQTTDHENKLSLYFLVILTITVSFRCRKVKMAANYQA